MCFVVNLHSTLLICEAVKRNQSDEESGLCACHIFCLYIHTLLSQLEINSMADVLHTSPEVGPWSQGKTYFTVILNTNTSQLKWVACVGFLINPVHSLFTPENYKSIQELAQLLLQHRTTLQLNDHSKLV